MKVDPLCPLEECCCVLNVQPEAENEAECQIDQYNGIWSFSSLSDQFKSSFGPSMSFFNDLHEINLWSWFSVLQSCHYLRNPVDGACRTLFPVGHNLSVTLPCQTPPHCECVWAVSTVTPHKDWSDTKGWLGRISSKISFGKEKATPRDLFSSEVQTSDNLMPLVWSMQPEGKVFTLEMRAS